MERSSRLAALAVLVLTGLLSSGCAMNELKNTNRRLKEANDRLVSENNRLEQELAASEKDLAEKNRLLEDSRKPAERVPAAAEEPRMPARGRSMPVTDIEGDGVEVRRVPEGILVRVEDRVLFATGKATLSPKGRAVLERVTRTLNSTHRGRLIRVEGHTDDVPVRKVRHLYPSNWELSTARACTVVRYMVEKGLSPSRVYPAGFASYKPATTARTEGGRQRNRRVEILILNQQV